VIALVVGAGVWAAATTNDNNVATSIPDTTAQVEPELAAVLSAIDAYNAGDHEAWTAAHAAGWTLDQFDEILMNANERLEVEGHVASRPRTRQATPSSPAT
jgi:hypothetical protein